MKRCLRGIGFLAVAALVALFPPPADACAVCFGAAEGPMAAGMNNAIWVLLGSVGLVQVGFITLFVSFRQRAKKLRQRREHFELLNGGAS